MTETFTDTAAVTAAPPRTAAVTAASALLAMAVLGIFGNAVVLTLTGDDAPDTLANVRAGEGTLRLAIVAFVFVAILDVVVAWALTRFFRTAQPGLATLAGWLRVAYAAALVAAVGELATATRLVSQPDPGGAANAIHGALLDFGATWQLALIVFSAHLAVLAFVVLRVAGTPSVLGVLLALAAAGYAIDGIAHVLLPADSPIFAVLTPVIVVPAAVGELALALWLLVRGGRSR